MAVCNFADALADNPADANASKSPETASIALAAKAAAPATAPIVEQGPAKAEIAPKPAIVVGEIGELLIIEEIDPDPPGKLSIPLAIDDTEACNDPELTESAACCSPDALLLSNEPVLAKPIDELEAPNVDSDDCAAIPPREPLMLLSEPLTAPNEPLAALIDPVTDKIGPATLRSPLLTVVTAARLTEFVSDPATLPSAAETGAASQPSDPVSDALAAPSALPIALSTAPSTPAAAPATAPLTAPNAPDIAPDTAPDTFEAAPAKFAKFASPVNPVPGKASKGVQPDTLFSEAPMLAAVAVTAAASLANIVKF